MWHGLLVPSESTTSLELMGQKMLDAYLRLSPQKGFMQWAGDWTTGN